MQICKSNEVGVDEVGRGSLSGPVYAAAVVLPDNFYHPLIKDSKKLSTSKREEAYNVIKHHAISIGVFSISPQEIDRINILQATFKAMIGAIENLNCPFQKLWVDGDKFPGYKSLDFECVVKGDSKILSIAAASIVAKVTRDEYMKQLSREFPKFGWDKNCGYGTSEHMQAIEKFGLTQHHRKSFCSRFL